MASRDGGTRKHAGVDIVVKDGEPVYAPFDLQFVRIAYPYKNYPTLEGAEYIVKNVNGVSKMKLFYFSPDKSKKVFQKGDVIGVAQRVSKKYDHIRKGMTDHVHFELYDQHGKIVDPTPFV